MAAAVRRSRSSRWRRRSMLTAPAKEDRRESKTSTSKEIPRAPSMALKSEVGSGSTGRRTSSCTASGHLLARYPPCGAVLTAAAGRSTMPVNGTARVWTPADSSSSNHVGRSERQPRCRGFAGATRSRGRSAPRWPPWSSWAEVPPRRPHADLSGAGHPDGREDLGQRVRGNRLRGRWFAHRVHRSEYHGGPARPARLRRLAAVPAADAGTGCGVGVPPVR